MTPDPGTGFPEGLRGTLLLAALSAGLSTSCWTVDAPTLPAHGIESASLKRVRQVFARIPEALARNHKTFAAQGGVVQGFGAGETYPQIWLRDSSWVVPAAAAYYEADALTSWLDLHLAAAQRNGRLRDWVASGAPEVFIEWAPRAAAFGNLSVDTNTNESDQEPGAALAYCRAREALGAEGATDPAHSGRVARLIRSMDGLLRDRTHRPTGLVWSGLTADWGDVSPLYPDQRAIYLDEKTPRTLSLYTNVMARAALGCLASLAGESATGKRLEALGTKLGEKIQANLWMAEKGYFRIRKSLDRTIAPAFGPGEDDRFALGGNALAALFRVADDAQAASIFEAAERRRVMNRFTTISTTLVPPYEAGVFLHPAMREPFQYQNGGQWDWFGAPLVLAEFERGHARAAKEHLDQIVARILRAGPGIHEWYAQDDSPKGSGSYAAAAAALHQAVVKGLLGVSNSAEGYRIAIRTGETLLPFDIPQRAAGTRLKVSQTVSRSAIEVEIFGAARISEVCSLLPPGLRGADPAAVDIAMPRRARTVGLDNYVCADTSSASLPIRIRFGLRP